MGLEPTTASLEGVQPADTSLARSVLTFKRCGDCISDCTSNAKNAHDPNLQTLADALRILSTPDRAKLAAMLSNNKSEPRK
jgi:hypothetical protein